MILPFCQTTFVWNETKQVVWQKGKSRLEASYGYPYWHFDFDHFLLLVLFHSWSVWIISNVMMREKRYRKSSLFQALKVVTAGETNWIEENG